LENSFLGPVDPAISDGQLDAVRVLDFPASSLSNLSHWTPLISARGQGLCGSPFSVRPCRTSRPFSGRRVVVKYGGAADAVNEALREFGLPLILALLALRGLQTGGGPWRRA